MTLTSKISTLLKAIILLIGFIQVYAMAAPFEIKVHDELISDYGESAYEIETNLFQAPTSKNIKTNVFQTRLEYGYGIAKNGELGANLYLSNYNGVSYINGGKISYMYVPTHDEQGLWHYGVKNEVNYIKDIGGLETAFYEFTPILALQLTDWRFTINPSIDITFGKNSAVTFSPSAKAAYSMTHAFDIGVEYYADNLALKGPFKALEQPNTAYLVMDTKIGKSSLNFGVGKGLSSASDNWVIKLIAALNFD